jgi:hypothetical protein
MTFAVVAAVDAVDLRVRHAATSKNAVVMSRIAQVSGLAAK